MTFTYYIGLSNFCLWIQNIWSGTNSIGHFSTDIDIFFSELKSQNILEETLCEIGSATKTLNKRSEETALVLGERDISKKKTRDSISRGQRVRGNVILKRESFSILKKTVFDSKCRVACSDSVHWKKRIDQPSSIEG